MPKALATVPPLASPPPAIWWHHPTLDLLYEPLPCPPPDSEAEAAPLSGQPPALWPWMSCPRAGREDILRNLGRCSPWLLEILSKYALHSHSLHRTGREGSSGFSFSYNHFDALHFLLPFQQGGRIRGTCLQAA